MQQNSNESQVIKRLSELHTFTNDRLSKEEEKFYRQMYLRLLIEGTNEELKNLKNIEGVKDTEKFFRVLQRMYFKKYKDSEEKPVLLIFSKTRIEKAIKEYFELKDGILQFKKDCFMGNTFKDKCQSNVFGRIKDFVHKMREALELFGLTIPRGFKLSDVNPQIKNENIKSAYDVLSDIQKKDSDVQAFVAMCPNPYENWPKNENPVGPSGKYSNDFMAVLNKLDPIKNEDEVRNLWKDIAIKYGKNDNPQDEIRALDDAISFLRVKLITLPHYASILEPLITELEEETQEKANALEVEHEDSVDAAAAAANSVRSGGRRSRYRRRPTKKYFKSRRHSSPKKKRHMKTKRHMKRHRKTKRH